MNRLCESSHGNLEAVINITGYKGEPQRKLIHFSRDGVTGQWSDCAVVSHRPKFGGSIIQNISPHRPDQRHGDLEVVVLEDDGILRHYTRDSAIPANKGMHAWRLSAKINEPEDTQSPVLGMLLFRPQHIPPGDFSTLAIDAAPIFQTQIPEGTNSDGTTLETLVLDSKGKMTHYRCPQLGLRDNSTDAKHQWIKKSTIPTGEVSITGPAYLFQKDDTLMALISHTNCINVWYFGSNNKWNRGISQPLQPGISCVYSEMIQGSSIDFALSCRDAELHVEAIPHLNQKNGEKSPLPYSLTKIRNTPHHRVLATNPISIISRANNAPGRSQKIDAIAFHACGAGWRDTWMILHWSRDVGANEWVVSDVVLPHVTGMPL
ncbi:hypothetical protein F5Y14DRAFT_460944 [Nemania sp. NC0429]|nr:hypothetical protein F5Y14DRAFT_460944 [Nemania sp. NC0429]